MKITLSRSQWEMIGKKAGWVKVAEGQRAGKAKQWSEIFKREYDMLYKASADGMDGKPDPFQMTPQQYGAAINKDLNLSQFLTDFPEYKDNVSLIQDHMARMQKEVQNPKSFFQGMWHFTQVLKDTSSALGNPENKY